MLAILLANALALPSVSPVPVLVVPTAAVAAAAPAAARTSARPACVSVFPTVLANPVALMAAEAAAAAVRPSMPPTLSVWLEPAPAHRRLGNVDPTVVAAPWALVLPLRSVSTTHV
jgi:hypothetical protein